jgi:hypothetical protein
MIGYAFVHKLNKHSRLYEQCLLKPSKEILQLVFNQLTKIFSGGHLIISIITDYRVSHEQAYFTQLGQKNASY